MITRNILAAALTVLGVSASAAPVLFECDVTEKHRNLNWIEEKMVFVVAEDGKVTVIDPVILYFEKGPLNAKVIRNNDKSLKVRWRVHTDRDSKNQRVAHFDYDATINKKTNRIGVNANPANFPNRFSGKGNCKVRTDGKLPATLR